MPDSRPKRSTLQGWEGVAQAIIIQAARDIATHGLQSDSAVHFLHSDYGERMCGAFGIKAEVLAELAAKR